MKNNRNKCVCSHKRADHKPDCHHLDKSRAPYETWQCKCRVFTPAPPLASIETDGKEYKVKQHGETISTVTDQGEALGRFQRLGQE